MFDLNPLQNPDALWQHLIMIVGAAIIGYVIGQLDSGRRKQSLETRLIKLSRDLESCQTEKKPLSSNKEKLINTVASAQQTDDLKVIEGIGPAIEQLLQANGIYTYTQLSETPPNQLTTILKNSGNNFQIHDPRTWPQQAKLAASEMWGELKELQKELNGGRSES